MTAIRVQVIALALFVVAVIAGCSATVFEDGSFIVGPVSGCIPATLCDQA